MLSLPIGLQLYSLRNEAAADFEGTLRQVKAMGYQGVEFAGLYDRQPSEIKGICEEIGLIPVSAHVPFVDMMQDPRGVISAYKEIGCMQVVIPYLTEEFRPGQPRFQEVIEGARILGEVCRELGMKLAYHNHDFEFVKLEGEYALDILYREVPATLLQTQLDTCWVNVGGENPVDYIHKYAGRMPTLHLKDFAGDKSDNMYALIGIDEEEDKAGKSDQKFELRPVGYGKQDFPSITAAAQEAGVSWLIVEQDEPSMGKTPVECAKLSIDYLKTL